MVYIIIIIILLGLFVSYPIPTILVIAGIGVYSIYSQKQKILVEEKIFNDIKKEIDKGNMISWEKFFEIKLDSQQENIKELIKQGISNKLFFGEIINSWGNINNEYLNEIKKSSLEFLDNFAIEKGLSSYSFVDIRRSSQEYISPGTYVYVFDENENILLLKAPIRFYRDIPFFDVNFIQDVILIEKSSIKDFQVFGAQLLETSTHLSSQTPGIKTIVSEALLGSSYSILKGLNSVSLNSTHSINDTRVVQVILNDKTDLELGGISIYYDFNRRFGNIKNKEIEANSIESIGNSNQKTIEAKTTYIDEIRNLKSLLDEGILTKEEFENKKRRLLEN